MKNRLGVFWLPSFYIVIGLVFALSACNSPAEEQWDNYISVGFAMLAKNPKKYDGKRIIIDCYMKTNQFRNSELFESFIKASSVGVDVALLKKDLKASDRFLTTKSITVILEPDAPPLRVLAYGLFRAPEYKSSEGFCGYLETIRRIDILPPPPEASEPSYLIEEKTKKDKGKKDKGTQRNGTYLRGVIVDFEVAKMS